MILGYPKWIDHQDMPIWSIDAQPNGYRLLTGGGDNKIKIWNILPIIAPQDDEDSELNAHIAYLESLFDSEEEKKMKLLATLGMHSSPINCVRWNTVGSLFASASDDGTIYIWEYHGVKRGTFEDKDMFQENWQAVKYLSGHKDSKQNFNLQTSLKLHGLLMDITWPLAEQTLISTSGTLTLQAQFTF